MTCPLKPMLSKTWSMPTYAFQKILWLCWKWLLPISLPMDNEFITCPWLLLHIRASIHACQTASWHIAVIKIGGAIYKGIFEPLLVEVVNEVFNSFPQYILIISMFSSLKKSFILPIYAEAMARASPPIWPSCIPRQHNVDLRVLEFLDNTAIVDASFWADDSDFGSTSLSRGISERMSSMFTDCSDVGHHLLRCLHLYFLLDWFRFDIEFAMRLPRPLPLIFMMVFMYSGLSFWCHVFCFFSL